MPKKRYSSAAARKRARAMRAHHAQARQIARKEKIPYQEARARVKEVYIRVKPASESLREAEVRAARVFMEWPPQSGKYYRVKKGKQATDPRNREKIDGRMKRYEYGGLRRIMGQYTYWALVDRTAQMFGKTIAEARQLLTRMRDEMTRTARAHGVKRKYRIRDAMFVLEETDRYQNVRMEFDI